jgi:hypothetical protein
MAAIEAYRATQVEERGCLATGTRRRTRAARPAAGRICLHAAPARPPSHAPAAVHALGPRSSDAAARVCRLTGGRAWQVAGLDVGWGQELDLQRERGSGRWTLTRELPPGRFPFKFIVDGRWTCSADHPTLMARRRPGRARRAGSRQLPQRCRHAAVQGSAGGESRTSFGPSEPTRGVPAWGAWRGCQRSPHAHAALGLEMRGALL